MGHRKEQTRRRTFTVPAGTTLADFANRVSPRSPLLAKKETSQKPRLQHLYRVMLLTEERRSERPRQFESPLLLAVTADRRRPAATDAAAVAVAVAVAAQVSAPCTRFLNQFFQAQKTSMVKLATTGRRRVEEVCARLSGLRSSANRKYRHRCGM